MSKEGKGTLSELMDELERSATGESISIEETVGKMGEGSFASLMLVFSLISLSPASAIPGLTSIVAVLVFILTAQMIIGRESPWLPGFITRRRMSTAKVCKGIKWLRGPLHFVDRFLHERLTFLSTKPLLLLPLICIMGLTLAMPFMELVRTSGSIASAVIALFAAGLLTRDGALILLSLVALLALPLALWYFGFGS